MRIAAILNVSDERPRTEGIPVPANQRRRTDKNKLGSVYRDSEILGETLLVRTLHQLEKIATLPPIILATGEKSDSCFASASLRPGNHLRDWEQAVAQQVERGADILLAARLNTYTDLDYQELLNFHCQTRSPFTQVYAGDSCLDVALLNVSSLADLNGIPRRPLSMAISGQRRFLYRGYVNRLRRPQDYYKLVEDGLFGRCAMKPRGKEITPGVWYGSGAAVDTTATIVPPAFVGANCHIAAGSTVFSASVERNCEIDCGTAVTNSWVLENTYVGLALEVRRSVVSNQCLFHLERDVELNIAGGGLIGVHAKTMPLLAHLESFFWGATDH